MQKIDYIIVGGGIAGITLAHHLLERKKKILLYLGTEKSSSRVAAGLYNPITGRKMVKTWKANEIFPYLENYYSDIQKKIGTSFFYKTPIYRPFFNVEEQNDWLGKSSDPIYKPYIKQILTKGIYTNEFKNPCGGLVLNYSGWVDTNEYIDKSIEYFNQHSESITIVKTNFDYRALNIREEKIIISDIETKFVIFSEGLGVLENHYFNWMPLRPLKGEILDIKLNVITNVIFNRGIFVLPMNADTFRVGSTYSHADHSWKITEEGKQQLDSKLKELISTEYKLVKHEAGLRPASRDRRPMIGHHPKFNNLLVFNGLGTKGVSLAPYFANQLIEHLEDGKDLDKEVNIERFFSLSCT